MTDGLYRTARPGLVGRKGLVSLTAIVAALALIAVSLFSAAAVAPANPEFEKTWARTDKPVADIGEGRTWMWGPAANTSAMQEDYAESPGGKRTVQYYDKARMEINNPSGDKSSLWYVTNGLLVREMTSGQVQVGDAAFEPHAPADNINVAGDPDDPNGPTYGSFAKVLDAEPLGVGSGDDFVGISWSIDRAGNVTHDKRWWSDYGVTTAYHEVMTNHTIARPFWDFMNSTGAVYEDGQYIEDYLFVNPFYATGYPISEAYWANVKVANAQKDVLIQCFERRCLTYTPSNLDGWKVEAGNVGQHYFRWRYDMTPPTPPSPTPSPTPGPAPDVEEAVYAASLTGANEIPAVDTDATASAYFYVHADGSAIDYSISVNGLANATAAHIHDGTANENGDVVVTLFTSSTPVTVNGALASGTIAADDLPEGWTIADLAAGMADGTLYVNIHTTEHAAGEIRGQLGALGDTAFSAVLLGANEAPPSGSTAVGALALAYDATDATLDFQLYVLNMTNITMAHIHAGAAGVNGPVVAPLFTSQQPVAGPFNGMLAESTLDAGDLQGQTMPHLVYLLLTQGAYGNVYSVDHPGGEIRGQIQVGGQTDVSSATYIADLDNTVVTDFTSIYMPIETDASGLALFWPNDGGTALNYIVIATKIDRVLEANLLIDNDATSGEAVATLLDSTANATGAVDGVLASGSLDDGDIFGPLSGSGISGLLDAIDAGDIYVSVRTIDNPASDIWGLVEPIS
ncbi:MAG TPA: CHRD domain-containing protein [Thermomicrobiales bacterium]|nr:CHRD domain-containing protein [Thermomicrobiales bacterium]